MKVIVLGGGGREHALVKAIRASKKITHLGCAPGNPGIAKDATTYLTDPQDPRQVVDLARRTKADLVVIGPEAPLACGVSDLLRQQGFAVFGPGQGAARLETSKVFSKQFMTKHKIPTADSTVCASAQELLAAAQTKPGPWVVKVDGLAAGKGVIICRELAEVEQWARQIFEKKVFGRAGEKVLLEDFIDGDELSLMVLVADGKYGLLPIAQDHKRLLDGDEGPNTGGMGAFAPVNQWKKLIPILEKQVVKPTIQGLVADHIDYRGILYIGCMVQKKKEPFVLEYNVRFGDPEAQVILPLLDGDWLTVMSAVAGGQVPTLKWKKTTAVCVVVCAPGYPDNPKKGLSITIDREVLKESATHYLLHAGTATHHGYITNGGRVVNLVAIDRSLESARKKAYQMVKAVELEGMQYRKDIGKKHG